MRCCTYSRFVYVWGYNGYCRLGLGNQVDVLTPKVVPQVGFLSIVYSFSFSIRPFFSLFPLRDQTVSDICMIVLRPPRNHARSARRSRPVKLGGDRWAEDVLDGGQGAFLPAILITVKAI